MACDVKDRLSIHKGRLSVEDITCQLLTLSSSDLEDVLSQVDRVRSHDMHRMSVSAEDDPTGYAGGMLVKRESLFKSPPPIPADASATCHILFCCHTCYAIEEETSVEVDVMRIGKVDEASSVPWHTCDGSAKAGKKYRSASGCLEFGPGQMYNTIKIEIIDNEEWDPTLDFFVFLDADRTCGGTVHRSGTRCRIKIIDNDIFPSNRFEKQLRSDTYQVPAAVPSRLLMIEYFKLNWRNSVVRLGSIKCLIVDLLVNLKYILHLFLNARLINKVFMPVLKGKEEFDQGRQLELIVIAFLFLLPDFLLHILKFKRNYWKVGGASRKLLQTNLMRAYMNYSANTRSNVEIGEVMLMAFTEIPLLVSEGYCSLFPLVRNVVQLLLGILFQLLLYPLGLSDLPTNYLSLISLIVFALFPSILLPALYLREGKSSRLMANVQLAHAESRSGALEMLHNFYLIADYGKRDVAATIFAKRIDKVNGSLAHFAAAKTNNLFITTSVTVVVIAAWILVGGFLLMNSELDLGLFQATLSIFRQMGKSWTAIYSILVGMQAKYSHLRTLTMLLNLPDETIQFCKFERQCEQMTRSLLPGLEREVEQLQDADFAIDLLPIKLDNVCHSFAGNRVLDQVSMTLAQGKFHVVSTDRSLGKSLILHLCGRRVLMNDTADSGNMYIPCHLKIRHISKEPLFLSGSLYMNLVYGVHEGDRDGRLERVLEICTQLGVTEDVLQKISDKPDTVVAHWNTVLSSSTRHLLNMARGIIANPEVLVVHKPFMDLGPHIVPLVRDVLRDFVDCRGLGNDESKFHQRRPRTCIASVRPDEIVDCIQGFADEAHLHGKGGEQIKSKKIGRASRQICRTSFTHSANGADVVKPPMKLAL